MPSVWLPSSGRTTGVPVSRELAALFNDHIRNHERRLEMRWWFSTKLRGTIFTYVRFPPDIHCLLNPSSYVKCWHLKLRTKHILEPCRNLIRRPKRPGRAKASGDGNAGGLREQSTGTCNHAAFFSTGRADFSFSVSIGRVLNHLFINCFPPTKFAAFILLIELEHKN